MYAIAYTVRYTHSSCECSARNPPKRFVIYAERVPDFSPNVDRKTIDMLKEIKRIVPDFFIYTSTPEYDEDAFWSRTRNNGIEVRYEMSGTELVNFVYND